MSHDHHQSAQIRSEPVPPCSYTTTDVGYGQTDRRTDGRTTCHGITALCIASCSNKGELNYSKTVLEQTGIAVAIVQCTASISRQS